MIARADMGGPANVIESMSILLLWPMLVAGAQEIFSARITATPHIVCPYNKVTLRWHVPPADTIGVANRSMVQAQWVSVHRLPSQAAKQHASERELLRLPLRLDSGLGGGKTNSTGKKSVSAQGQGQGQGNSDAVARHPARRTHAVACDLDELCTPRLLAVRALSSDTADHKCANATDADADGAACSVAAAVVRRRLELVFGDDTDTPPVHGCNALRDSHADSLFHFSPPLPTPPGVHCTGLWLSRKVLRLELAAGGKSAEDSKGSTSSDTRDRIASAKARAALLAMPAPSAYKVSVATRKDMAADTHADADSDAPVSAAARQAPQVQSGRSATTINPRTGLATGSFALRLTTSGHYIFKLISRVREGKGNAGGMNISDGAERWRTVELASSVVVAVTETACASDAIVVDVEDQEAPSGHTNNTSSPRAASHSPPAEDSGASGGDATDSKPVAVHDPPPVLSLGGVIALTSSDPLLLPHAMLPIDIVDTAAPDASVPGVGVGHSGGVGSWSMALWLYLASESAGQFRTVFYKGHGQQRTPSAWIEPHSRRLNMRVSTVDSVDVGLNSESELPLHSWCHVLFTFHNTSLGGIPSTDTGVGDTAPKYARTAYTADGHDVHFELRMYLNGVLDQSARFHSPVRPNGAPLSLGKDPTFGGAPGMMAELRLWARALLPAEVFALHRASLPRFSPALLGDTSDTASDNDPGAAAIAAVVQMTANTTALAADATDAAHNRELAVVGMNANRHGLTARARPLNPLSARVDNAGAADAGADALRRAEDAARTAAKQTSLSGAACLAEPAAMELLLEAAEAGHREAQFKAGMVLLHGGCREQDGTLLQPTNDDSKAAGKGDTDGASESDVEEDDKDKNADTAEGISAASDPPSAMFGRGRGSGGGRSVAAATALLMRAARAGHGKAAHQLAVLLAHGHAHVASSWKDSDSDAEHEDGSTDNAAVGGAQRHHADQARASGAVVPAAAAAAMREKRATLARKRRRQLAAAESRSAIAAKATALGWYHAAASLGVGASQLALATRYTRQSRQLRDSGNIAASHASAEAGAFYYSVCAKKAHGFYHAHGRQPLHTFDKISPSTEAHVEVAQRGDDDERLQYQAVLAEQGDVASMAAMADLLYWGARGFDRDHPRALRYWTQAAEAGDPISMAAAAGMYLKGEGLPGDAPNKTAALRWYEAAANSTNAVARVRALNGMGYAYFFGGAAGFEKNATAAFDCFTRAAAHHLEGDSAYNAAHCLRNGFGVERDLARAVDYLRDAAHKFGQFDAVYELGMLHLQGGGSDWLHGSAEEEALAVALGGGRRLSRSEAVEQALRYLEPAARAGEWGLLGRQGFDRYLARDMDGAVLQYMEAAELGFGVAPGNIAHLYDLRKASAHVTDTPMVGVGPVEEAGATMKQNTDAAAIGDTKPNSASGSGSGDGGSVTMDQDNGSGVREQEEQQRRALHFYLLAADSGDGEAMLRLGDYFYYGLARLHCIERQQRYGAIDDDRYTIRCDPRVPESPGSVAVDEGDFDCMACAVHWYRRAAHAGIPQAHYNLGYMYERGVLGIAGLETATASVSSPAADTEAALDYEAQRAVLLMARAERHYRHVLALDSGNMEGHDSGKGNGAGTDAEAANGDGPGVWDGGAATRVAIYVALARLRVRRWATLAQRRSGVAAWVAAKLPVGLLLPPTPAPRAQAADVVASDPSASVPIGARIALPNVFFGGKAEEADADELFEWLPSRLRPSAMAAQNALLKWLRAGARGEGVAAWFVRAQQPEMVWSYGSGDSGYVGDFGDGAALELDNVVIALLTLALLLLAARLLFLRCRRVMYMRAPSRAAPVQ